MNRMFSKFSPPARNSLGASLIELRPEGHSSARSAVAYLRPKIQPPMPNVTGLVFFFKRQPIIQQNRFLLSYPGQ